MTVCLMVTREEWKGVSERVLCWKSQCQINLREGEAAECKWWVSALSSCSRSISITSGPINQSGSWLEKHHSITSSDIWLGKEELLFKSPTIAVYPQQKNKFISVLPPHISQWMVPPQTTLCHLWKCSADNLCAGRKKTQLWMSNWQFDSLYSLLHRESQEAQSLNGNAESTLVCAAKKLFWCLHGAAFRKLQACRRKKSWRIHQHNTLIWVPVRKKIEL